MPVYAATERDYGIFEIKFERPSLSNNTLRAFAAEREDLDCQYSFFPLVDARDNKVMVGTTSFDRPLRASGVYLWLADYKAQMLDPLSDQSLDSSKPSIGIHIELLRLYSYPNGTAILGMIATRVTIETSGITETLYMRGYSANTNVDSFFAYEHAISEASHDLASKLTKELDSRCRLIY